jgi:hypothetical protein
VIVSTACGKINFERVTFFSDRKTTIQRTTKDHQLTTNSPQKTIQKTQVSQNPLKNTRKSAKNLPTTPPDFLPKFRASSEAPSPQSNSEKSLPA